jgi:mitochondrial inner membrane protein COX18
MFLVKPHHIPGAFRRVTRSTPTQYGPHLQPRRTFITETLAAVGARLPCEEFLDLALALPIPPSFPPYTTTILAVTVASRLIFTVPFAIWVRPSDLV